MNGNLTILVHSDVEMHLKCSEQLYTLAVPQICDRNVGKQSKEKLLGTESQLKSQQSSNTVGSRRI